MPSPQATRHMAFRGPGLAIAVGLCWLWGFVGWCFTFDLPNNPRVSRWDLLTETPWLLLDLIDPPPPPVHEPVAATIARRSGWRFAPQRTDLLLTAAVLGGIAWGWGAGLLSLLGLRFRLGTAEHTFLSLSVGLAAVSLATLLSGLCGDLSRGSLGPALVIPAMIGAGATWWSQRRTARSSATAVQPCQPATDEEPLSRWTWLAAGAVLLPFLSCMLLGAMLPSTDFDVNEYHFEGPKEYYLAGRISFLPHNVYTSFPFATEMLTLAAMVVRGDWYRGALAGKTLLMCFAPLTAVGIYGLGRDWFGRGTGLAGAMLYLTTPWVYRISIIAYTEGALCCYLMGATWAASLTIDALRQGSSSNGGRAGGLALVCGFLAGTAMACKYPGLVSVVLPIGIALMLAIKGKTSPGAAANDACVGTSLSKGAHASEPQVTIAFVRTRTQVVLMYALGVSLAIGPWLFKNWHETGNPVYPLLYTVFDGRNWDLELNEKWRRAHSPHDHRPTDLAEKVVDVAARSDWQSPLLFGLAPLAWFASGGGRRKWVLAGFIGYLFLTWWTLTHRIDRFWLPLLPLASVLAGCGAAGTGSRRRADEADNAQVPSERVAGPRPWSGFGMWRVWGIAPLAAVVTLYHLAFITTGLCGYNQYLLDLDVAQQLTTQLTAPDIAWLNTHLPEKQRVLSVGEAAVFDAQFPILYDTVFDHSRFEEWCGMPGPVPSLERPVRPAEDIRQRFAQEKVSHILVNWREVLRYRAQGSYGYTDFVSPGRFRQLVRIGVLGPPLAIPEAQEELEAIPSDWRDAAIPWSRDLIHAHAGKPMLTTFQVYPVLPQGM